MVFTKPSIKILKSLTVLQKLVASSQVLLLMFWCWKLHTCSHCVICIPTVHYISHSVFNRRMWSTTVFSGSVQQANQSVSEGTKRQAPSLFSYWWEHDGGGWGWRWYHRWERCQVVPSELWGMELRMVCRDTLWILTRW